MKRYIYLIVILVLIISACEGMIYVSGTVVDEDGIPIENAQVVGALKYWTSSKPYSIDTVYTDSAGNFAISSGLIGCVPCPKMVMTVSKTGYITFSTTDDNNLIGDTTADGRKKIVLKQ